MEYNTVKVSILGEEYRIIFRDFKDSECDGLCDPFERTIEIRSDNTSEVGGFEELQKRTLRHEIIHAYLFESGLGFNWCHVSNVGHDETTIDWFALMSPRIFNTFTQLNLL